MRLSGGVLCAIAGFVVPGSLAAPAVADERLDLMKQGKEAFAAQCLGCHQTVEEAAAGYRNRPTWEQIVADSASEIEWFPSWKKNQILESLLAKTYMDLIAEMEREGLS